MKNNIYKTIKTICKYSILFGITAPTLVLASANIPWQIDVGIAYDDNPFRTPDSTYTDFAQAGNPIIIPNKQSGFFIPVVAEVQLSDESAIDSRFDSSYKLKADKYLSANLENADQYVHALSFGKSLLPGSNNTNNGKLYTEFNIDIARKTYYDRDDGLPKTTSGGTDISNRYEYFSYGVTADYDKTIVSQPITFSAAIEKLNYSDPIGTTQLDHTRKSLGISSETRVSSAMKFKYGYQYENRDYSNRHARDPLATLTTQLLNYDYNILDLTLRNRINTDLTIYFDYQWKQRIDDFAGYNDYTLNKFKVRGIYKHGSTGRTRVAVSSYKIDYSNAFNFEDPTQGSKTTDVMTLDIKTEFEYRGYQWWASMEMDNKDSTDARYQYDRYIASIGITRSY